MFCMHKQYQQDLAYIHHHGFGEFARKAAPGLLRLLRRRKITGGLIVDLGCGSGIWARALTDAGYEVLGVDISSAMIQLARRNAPPGKFRTGSFFKTKLPLCNAVTALGEVLNYQFDRHNQSELIQFFVRVYVALRPGGVFIFDIAEPGYVRGANPQRTYAEGEDWAILLEKETERKCQTLTRTMTIFRRVGKLYRRSEEVHRVQLYRGSAIVKALRRVGFKVKLLRGYGDLRFRKTVVGVLAARP